MVEFKKRLGTRAEVMHGTAKMTSGGLMKKDLKYNKRGKIVSAKASAAAKKTNNLVKAGYTTKKGVFLQNRTESQIPRCDNPQLQFLSHLGAGPIERAAKIY